MKLTDSYRIEIHGSKLTGYLLNPMHPNSWSKAKFFMDAGITSADVLQAILIELVNENSVASTFDSPFGTKYIVEGSILLTGGSTLHLRTVWIVLTGEDICKFVTAYPL